MIIFYIGLGALGGINAYIRTKLAKEILGITDNKALNDPLLFDKPLVGGSQRRRIKIN